MADRTIPIAINATLTEKAALDILTTCYEGACAYWLACNDLHRNKDGNVDRILGLHDTETGERDDVHWKDAPQDATADTIAAGIAKIINEPDKVNLAASIRQDVMAVLLDYENANWDAETADCILQVGMFGELVYG